jgi:hypothetical protein
MTSTQNPVARAAAEHPAIVKLGRIGWLAKGIVYLLAGGLALLIVTRSFGWSDASTGNTEASPTGAIRVAHSGGRPLLLVVLAIGMFLYAAWRVATAVLREHRRRRYGHPPGYIVSAIIYTAFGLTAISLARAPASNANSNQKVTDMTGRLMQHTAGRWLIGVAGVIAIGAGIYRIVEGLRWRDRRRRHGRHVGPAARWARRLGAIGNRSWYRHRHHRLLSLRAAIALTLPTTGLDGASAASR